MNVAGFLRWALTKPVIIVLVLIAGIAGGAVGWRSTTSHFETSAAVLVIGPGAGSHNAMDNPFTGLNSGAAQMAHVLTTVAQSAEGRAALEATGSSPDVVMIASAGDGSSQQISPLITFTVSAPEAWRARAGALALIEFWRKQLHQMQVDAGVVGDTFADLRVPVEPQDGSEVGGNPLRAALGLAMGAALGTLALCLIVAAGVEAVRNRRRRAAAADESGQAPTTPIIVADAGTPVAAPGTVDPATAPTEPEPASALVGVVRSGRSGAPAARPIRPPGDATRRAMTRWRDRVEEVPEESEIPLPGMDDGDPAPVAQATEPAGGPDGAADAPVDGASEPTGEPELPRAQNAR